jgi:hypothetical protein
VCRAWRRMLAPGSLWVHLDLSDGSGVTARRNDAALLAASARARGQLQSLNLNGYVPVSEEAVRQVLQANSTSMRELSCVDNVYRTVTELDAWVAAAPGLCCIRFIFQASVDDAVRLMCNEPRRLQLHDLSCEDDAAHPTTTPLPALFAAVRAHASLRELTFCCSIELHEVDALVDAVLAHGKLYALNLWCGLTAASVGSLARLLNNSRTLERLQLLGGDEPIAPLFDKAAGALFAAALAGNTTLKTLDLQSVDFWSDGDGAAAVLQAVAGHPSLVSLQLAENFVRDAAHAGALLAAVLAADAPALTHLNINDCDLGDAGFAPLLDALAQNTRTCASCPAISRRSARSSRKSASSRPFRRRRRCVLPGTRESGKGASRR